MLAPLQERLSAETGVPLVVDLDGTLIRSDLLIETFFAEVGRSPGTLLRLLRLLLQGRAAVKGYLADADLDVAALPYDPVVLAAIAEARAAGRLVYLASASNERLVERIADHLGLFDGWFASDEQVNLKGEAKAERLAESFGAGGFDYIGNEACDLAVWRRANRAIAVRLDPASRRRLTAIAPAAEILETPRASLRTWLKLVRVHQYAKNALVFVPLLMAHRFELGVFLDAFLAFVAFSLCASSVYLLNDLVDLQADRAHPTKRRRALASGDVPLASAMVAAPLFLAAAFALSLAVSPAFALVLLVYCGLTTAYSFALKRKMLVDVVTLAGLYTIRLVGGGIAVGVVVSNWLLAFAMFMFVSLALIKRYVELASRLDRGLPNPSNRNYELSDLSVVAALAAAAGYNAVVVLALYLSSDAVIQLYRRPEVLWFVCPVVLYWISRALLMAHRRMMDDDPIVFALRDRVSLVALGTTGALVLAAI